MAQVNNIRIRYSRQPANWQPDPPSDQGNPGQALHHPERHRRITAAVPPRLRDQTQKKTRITICFYSNEKKGDKIMDFNINKFAFLYGDYQYFQWFREKTEGHLKSVIKWKRLRKGTPDTNDIWSKKKQDLDEDAIKDIPLSRIVTRAFLFHLKWPTEYPILDSNVFEAMRKLDENYRQMTHANKISWEQDYINGYKRFFQEFYKHHEEEINDIRIADIPGVNEEIIRRKILDRALWSYGREK